MKKTDYYIIILIVLLSLAAGYKYSMKVSHGVAPDSEYLKKYFYILHNGSLENGGFLIGNRGNRTISNIILRLRPVKELPPYKKAYLEESMRIAGRNLSLKIIRNVKIEPEKINIKKLEPGETVYIPVKVTPMGSGNYFEIEVLLRNIGIYRVGSFTY
jgi:hypothetical protein